ncbi:DUF4136 domain-containing protein [Pontibacter sp. FD36]|uniref:DUF4136 domain-containing protein n=1 Tax=Pontibacter sp. FD36 TaxID=2789860 RepID=UPI0018A89A00|nr:DUF4136 domain-containing protein [Pontibacter sp. FD36]MBF8962397.1 DUF4136 domain-containing protein [Pontibacter sp. FD36]
MKNKLSSALYLVLCALFFSSCVATSGIDNTSTISSSEGVLSKKSTYAWYQPTPSAQPTYGQGFDADLHKHLLQSIEEELQRKGYTKTTVNPDMLVAYDVSVSVPDAMDKPELYGPGFGYSYAYMSGYRYSYGNAELPGYRAVDLFKQGTLIVDVIEPKSKQLLWRGWTEGAVKNFDANYSKVRSLVQEIVKRLPAAVHP